MFWSVVIDRILSISVDSTGVRILFLGLARNLPTIGREFRRKRVGFHTEFTFL